MNDDSREWAPLADVAAATGVSIDTIRRRMKRGDIETRREQTPQGFRWLAPLPDLLIASAALEFDLMVVTSNVHDFEDIPGLKVYQPLETD